MIQFYLLPFTRGWRYINSIFSLPFFPFFATLVLISIHTCFHIFIGGAVLAVLANDPLVFVLGFFYSNSQRAGAIYLRPLRREPLFRALALSLFLFLYLYVYMNKAYQAFNHGAPAVKELCTAATPTLARPPLAICAALTSHRAVPTLTNNKPARRLPMFISPTAPP